MAKQFLQLVAAEGENLFHVAPDEEAIDQFPAQNGIADVAPVK